MKNSKKAQLNLIGGIIMFGIIVSIAIYSVTYHLEKNKDSHLSEIVQVTENKKESEIEDKEEIDISGFRYTGQKTSEKKMNEDFVLNNIKNDKAICFNYFAYIMGKTTSKQFIDDNNCVGIEEITNNYLIISFKKAKSELYDNFVKKL